MTCNSKPSTEKKYTKEHTFFHIDITALIQEITDVTVELDESEV